MRLLGLVPLQPRDEARLLGETDIDVALGAGDRLVVLGLGLSLLHLGLVVIDLPEHLADGDDLPFADGEFHEHARFAGRHLHLSLAEKAHETPLETGFLSPGGETCAGDDEGEQGTWDHAASIPWVGTEMRGSGTP
jgi:hypothetical protein